MQGRNNVTRVRVEPRPFDQGRRKNDAFTHSATLPTNCNSCLDENSKFQLDRFSIMRKCNSAYEAKMHDALLIKKQNSTINKQMHANGISFLLSVY